MTKAIIFDKDGVIVDSEPLQWQSFSEIVAKYGGQKYQYVHLMTGQNTRIFPKQIK